VDPPDNEVVTSIPPPSLPPLHASKIRNGVLYARFDAITVGLFGIASIVLAATARSIPGMLVGLGMCLIAFREFQQASELAHLDPQAPGKLAWNQLLFSGLLLAYAIWAFSYGWRNPQPYITAIEPQLYKDPNAKVLIENGDFSVEQFVRIMLVMIYGTLTFVAITVQPITALFYLTRRKYLRV
jgi:hypothetical protein